MRLRAAGAGSSLRAGRPLDCTESWREGSAAAEDRVASAAPGGILLGWVREPAADGDEAFQQRAPRAFVIQTLRPTRRTGEYDRSSPCLDARPDCRGRAANGSCAKGRCATCGEGSPVDWCGAARVAAASTSTADVAEASSIGGLPRQCMLLESAYRLKSRSRHGRRRHWRRGRWRSRMRGTWSWLQLQSYAAPGVRPIKHACNRPPSAPCPPCALPSACSSAGVGQKARHPA